MVKMKFAGAMVDLGLLGILFITGNFSLEWWKVLGMLKYGILQPLGRILLLSLNQV